MMSTPQPADRPVIITSLLVITTLFAFISRAFDLHQAWLLLVGVGIGYVLMHALFGFSGGWRSFVRERRSQGIRAQIGLLALTSLLFFPVLGGMFGVTGTSAALAPVGMSVLIGAFLFGIGMQLGGGCGSGTLFTVGWGQIDMLLALSFFIVGATLGSMHLPWWLTLPSLGKISVIQSLGWLPALFVQFSVLGLLYFIVLQLERVRHGSAQALITNSNTSVTHRLIFGGWPLWWAIVALAILNLATLLLAGHPWSITFAFALWGAKIWSALGGDLTAYSFWASGYQVKALNSSVLADVTSLMDFGIILGSMLAAALAGKFAPEGRLKPRRIATAVLGGLLMGYGARLAFGCNIGGLLAGISSGSLHGWLWLVMGFMGSWLGVRMRAWIQQEGRTA